MADTTGVRAGVSDMQNRPSQPQQESLVRRGAPGSLARRGLYSTPQRGPFGLMRQMMDEMDRAFGDFFAGSPWRREADGGGAMSTWAPQVEVLTRGDQLVVRADLPGLKRDEVQVEMRDDMLILQGERRQQHEEKNEGLYRSERSYGQFYRAIPLPEGIDAEQAKASFHDGVLEVTMPSPPQKQKGRKIEVSEGPARQGGDGRQKAGAGGS